jgi:hypothetical protein
VEEVVMRYVSEITPVATAQKPSLVPVLSSVQAVKPIHSREQTVFQVTTLRHSQHTETVEPDKDSLARLPLEDRRKACRRFHTQRVLVELRSGVDRRHHDLLGNHAVEHIDEQA